MLNSSAVNFLWLVMEDTTERFGCAGDEQARTPNIDALAEEGLRYPNAFSTAGVCAPSRASLMTGMYPASLGAHHMRTETHDVKGLPDPYEAVPPHYVTAFTEYLRAAGYYCTLDWKTDYQFGEPFTMWDHHGGGAGWWDEERDDGQPFFAMMTNTVTHESGMRPPSTGGEIEDPETDPSAVSVPPYLPDTKPTRTAIARQYDNIATSDAWVGRILDRLAADGHAEETVVVLTSDHGEGLPRRKRWPYDSGTNVPLIIRVPAETGGETREELVSLVDLPAATLSLAGVDPPQYMDGRPFLDSNTEPREYVFTTRDRYDEEYDMMRSVRSEQFRYIRNYYPERPYVLHIPYRNQHPGMQELLRLNAHEDLNAVQSRMFETRPAEELYDVHADPHEIENLAGNPAYESVLQQFRDTLDEWRVRTEDLGAGEEAETEMRDRIWPNGEQPRTTAPAFVPNAPGNRGQGTTKGGEFEGPMTITLYSPTQGASIAYTTDDGADPHWKLYTGPLRFKTGETVTMRAKAIRYGYGESEEVNATFTIT